MRIKSSSIEILGAIQYAKWPQEGTPNSKCYMNYSQGVFIPFLVPSGSFFLCSLALLSIIISHSCGMKDLKKL